MVRRGALGGAVIGTVCCFFLAFFGLMFLSNFITAPPEGTRNPQSYSSALGFELFLIFIFCSVFGLYRRTDPKVMGLRPYVMALAGVPVLLFPILISTFYVTPAYLATLAVLQPLGIAIGIYSLASWPGSGVEGNKLARVRFLVHLQFVWFLVVVAALISGMVLARWASIVVIFPSLLFLGLILAWEGLIVRDATVAGAVWRIGTSGNTAPGTVDDEGGNARPPVARRPLWMAVLLSIFLVAYIPFLFMLGSPPSVVITSAEASTNGGIDVTVVNRGAEAVTMIELWIDGEWMTTIQYIDGFGIWEGRGLAAHGARSITLRIGVKEVAGSGVYYSPNEPEPRNNECSIVWVVLGIVAACGAVPRAARQCKK